MLSGQSSRFTNCTSFKYNEPKYNRRCSFLRKFNWVGVIIILIGVALLLSNLNIIQGISVWSLILPFLLLLCGLSSMISSRRINYWGLILFLAGAYWMLVRLNVLPGIGWEIITPGIIILIGIGIILPFGQNKNTNAKQSPNAAKDGYVHSTAIFSGDERFLSGERFTGANITTVFGGCDLDFTGFQDASPATVIHFTVAFAGADIILPPEWKVERRGLTCLFGGMDIKGAPAPTASKTVELSGVCVFGGITVKYRPHSTL